MGDPRMIEAVKQLPGLAAFPAVVEWLKVAGQPVPGPWPPHQEPRPDPSDESGPVAVRDE